MHTFLNMVILLFIQYLLCYMHNILDLTWPNEVVSIYDPCFVDEETLERLVLAQLHHHLPGQ